METSIMCAFSLMVASVCLMSAGGASSQDARNGNKELWDTVWKNIRADNEKVGDKSPAPAKDFLKNSNWKEQLQNHLDTVASPTHTAPAYPRTKATHVDREIDFKAMLHFLKESGITLSNDQWMSFLQYALSTDNNKLTSSAKPTTTTSTTGITTSPLLDGKTTTTIPSDGGDQKEWLKKLSLVLDADPSVENAKTVLNLGTTAAPQESTSGEQKGLVDKGIITDEQWYNLLERVMTNSDDKSRDVMAAPSTTISPSSPSASSQQTSPSEAARVDKKNVSISDQQWEALLGRSFNGGAKRGDANDADGTSEPRTVTSTQKQVLENKVVLRKNGVIPDEEWQRVLQETLDGDKKQKQGNSNGGDKTLTKVPETKTHAVVSGSHLTNDTQWQRLVEKALGVNRGQGDSNVVSKAPRSTATTVQTTSEKSSADSGNNDEKLSDQQWLGLLEHAMGNNEHDDESDAVGDRQWEQLLQSAMDNKLSSTVKSKLEHVMEQAYAPTTQSSLEKELSGQEEPSMSDQEWDRILQEAMDNGHHDESKSASRSAFESKPRQLNTQITSGPLQERTTPISSTLTEDKDIPRSQDPLELSSVENIENDDGANTNFVFLLGVGIGSGVILVVLLVALTLTVCRRKGVLCWAMKDKHTTILNSDGNRWDPQTLRPSKENMNAFLYSIPAPMREIKIDF